MKEFLSVFAAFGFVLSASVVNAAVWETTAQWTPYAEVDYQEWVQKNWHKNFLNQGGPLQGMKVDCADVVYTMRVMYAQSRGLPFAMKDPTVRVGPPITNEMNRWDSEPPAKRIRSFLMFIHGIGSTASLPADTYPTAINRSNLHSGSLILTDRAKHHSWTIQNFSKSGIPYLLYSSRPAKTIFQERNEYPSVAFVFPNGIRPETNAGFRNFRQPQDIGRMVSDVPGFSLEQYSLPAAKWMKTVQQRMELVAETPAQRLGRSLTETCKAARDRVEAIRDAVKFNEDIGSRCMSAVEYDDFSTPSRDQRLRDSFVELESAYQDFQNASGGRAAATNPSLNKNAASVLSGELSVGDLSAACTIDIEPGEKMTLGQVYARSVGDKLSHNPHDSLKMRWGLEPGPSAKASLCPVY